MRVALLASDEPHARYLEAKLSERFNVCCVVTEPGRDKRSRLLQKKKYKDYAFSLYHLGRRKLLGHASYRRRHFALSSNLRNGEYPRLTAASVNDESVVRVLTDARPDVTVVLNTSIIGKKVLEVAGGEILNIHGGYLPDYRGRQTIFFPLYEGRFDRIGSTIHHVTRGIDAGDIVEIVLPPICAGDDEETLYCKSDELAIHRLMHWLAEVENGGHLPRVPQEGEGKMYRDRDRTPLLDMRFRIRKWTGRLIPASAVKLNGSHSPDGISVNHPESEKMGSR